MTQKKALEDAKGEIWSQKIHIQDIERDPNTIYQWANPQKVTYSQVVKASSEST